MTNVSQGFTNISICHDSHVRTASLLKSLMLRDLQCRRVDFLGSRRCQFADISSLIALATVRYSP